MLNKRSRHGRESFAGLLHLSFCPTPFLIPNYEGEALAKEESMCPMDSYAMPPNLSRLIFPSYLYTIAVQAQGSYRLLLQSSKCWPKSILATIAVRSASRIL